MATFPKNHNNLYFDALIRTQKAESLLSLIHATYHAKKAASNDGDVKADIAKRLQYSYGLFKDNVKGYDNGVGSYMGTEDQFASQYTLGHEMAIWKNSNLDLNELAAKVARNIITVRQYLDVVLLNYVQPVNGTCVHPLHAILSYMKKNGTLRISKEEMATALIVPSKGESINALFQILIASSYFRTNADKQLCFTNHSTLDSLLSRCDLTYVGEDGYAKAQTELSEDAYNAYIIKDNLNVNNDDEQPETLIVAESTTDAYDVEVLGRLLKQMYDNAENKTTAIHMFGIKYGQIIKNYALQVTAIVEASGLSSNYHVEVSKGIRIYESISNNEFGVKFYSSDDAIVESCVSEKTLPVLKPRARTLYSLNNILYGAPGTGKTYSTAQYAVAIADCKPLSVIQKTERKQLMARYNELISDGRIVFTTFHQNYGYEDFIQGIRPDTTAETMSFRTVDGVFKVIAEKAMAHPELDYIIIIDEINRANISKVFGELITLIENDKRWGEVNAIDATLPSGEIFAVPNNLYIIGTMNSADKSISLIDTALRRRFDFVEFEPNAELILDSELRKVLIKLNEGISAELGSTDLLIGHSYFMGKTIEDLCDVMNRNVIPLLYEYFFDNQKKVEAQIKAATVGYDVEVKVGGVGRIKLQKKGNE